ncbi:unnamed protein product [Moneuplotes crassus]|uniref:Uncharacterized protein n=1 Tax=Euplotes crassus TaxID=5936 RepID=A0AAD1XVD4_EUPCR|nr:unnamed protein product [Moneuplotes crassus]
MRFDVSKREFKNLITSCKIEHLKTVQVIKSGLINSKDQRRYLGKIKRSMLAFNLAPKDPETTHYYLWLTHQVDILTVQKRLMSDYFFDYPSFEDVHQIYVERKIY